MGLTIVTGGANTGKTGVLHTAIREAAASGQDAVLLLPSGPEVSRAVEEFSQERAALGISIAQFDRYLDQLWDLFGDGRAIVQPTQRTLAVSAAIDACELKVLSRSAGRPGFARLLESLVRRAGESLALDGDRASVAHVPAARELLSLVDSYALSLAKSGLVEASEAHRLVTRSLEAADLPPLIVANRFASFTPAQREFLLHCSGLGCDVRVAIPWIEGHPAMKAATQTLDELRTVRHDHVLAEEAGYDVPELRLVRESLFCATPGAEYPTPTGAVTLSEAAGTAGEAARIAREIQELSISDIPYSEIAVVYRRPEHHMARLISAFREAGIPAEFDAQISVGATGFGRALLLLLRFECAGQKRTDLTGFLRSGFAWAESGAVDHMDEKLRRGRIASGRAVMERARATGARTRVLLERASALAAAPLDAQAVDGWRWLAADMLRSAHGSAAILDDRGTADAAAQRTVMAAVEEIAALGEGTWGAREVLAVLETARVTLTPARTQRNHVQVMSAERARSRRFTAVIVGGLTTGEFPEVPTDDALSSPEMAAELMAAGIDNSARVDADDERLLFYQIVTGARERLVLSRMVCDDDGRPVRASSLWEEFLDLYRDPVTGEPRGRAGLPVRRLELGDLTETEDAPRAERRRLRAAALAADASDPRVGHAMHRVRPKTGCLGEELVSELASLDTFSASEIEAYISCPFKWFYDKKLRPGSLADEIDDLQKGSLAHEIMQRFYEKRAELGQGRLVPENIAEALEHHAAIAEEVLANGPSPDSLRDEEMLHAAVVGTRRVIRRDAHFLPGFEPVAHELRFATKDHQPALDIGTFFLKGSIDRVDASSEGIVVIDYKSGSSVSTKSDFEKKGLVQLPLYGLVASALLQKPLLGGLYRSMQYGGDRGFVRDSVGCTGGLVRTDLCDAEEFSDVLAAAIARAERAVAGMRAGAIAVEPHDSHACTFCGAAGMCGRASR